MKELRIKKHQGNLAAIAGNREKAGEDLGALYAALKFVVTATPDLLRAVLGDTESVSALVKSLWDKDGHLLLPDIGVMDLNCEFDTHELAIWCGDEKLEFLRTRYKKFICQPGISNSLELTFTALIYPKNGPQLGILYDYLHTDVEFAIKPQQRSTVEDDETEAA